MSIDLIETIRVENGRVYNLEWHNRRLNRSRSQLFKLFKPLNLENYLSNIPPKGLFRCRVIYNRDVVSIEYLPYTPREIASIKIVNSNVEYGHKYRDRGELNSLIKGNMGYDEVIIERRGLVTDTTIANIAFYDGRGWITPQTPLLEGTLRAKLLHEAKIVPKDIKSEELNHFSHFALMNAMIGFQIQKNIIIYDKKREYAFRESTTVAI
jgi:4-amino-4-deoxychorismate lyase